MTRCLNCNFRSFWTTEDDKACLLCMENKELLLQVIHKENKVGILGSVSFNGIPENIPRDMFTKQILLNMPLFFWTDTIGYKYERIKV